MDAVNVEWGSWLWNVASFVGTVLMAVAVPAVMKAAGPFAGVLQMLRIDQLLEKAITYGINRIAGASKDKVLTLQISNDVLREAVSYAVKHAPDLVKAFGGADAIREKILARLNVDPAAAAG